MIIHNTTYHVENEMNSLFVLFLKEHYIPRATESGLFTNPRLLLIQSQHVAEGVNYSLQFSAKDEEAVNIWFKQVGDNLNRTLTLRFGNEVLGFVTLLDEINLD